MIGPAKSNSPNPSNPHWSNPDRRFLPKPALCCVYNLHSPQTAFFHSELLRALELSKVGFWCRQCSRSPRFRVSASEFGVRGDFSGGIRCEIGAFRVLRWGGVEGRILTPVSVYTMEIWWFGRFCGCNLVVFWISWFEFWKRRIFWVFFFVGLWVVFFGAIDVDWVQSGCFNCFKFAWAVKDRIFLMLTVEFLVVRKFLNWWKIEDNVSVFFLFEFWS